MTLEHLIEVIKNNKGRITPQREIILRYLVEHQDSLLTVDTLLQMCQEENPDINLTTIYRNLELLENLDLLYKMNVDSTTSGYKLACTERHHHHHIICKDCGKMVPISICPMSEELENIARKSGFTITDHVLEFYGICDNCKSKH